MKLGWKDTIINKKIEISEKFLEDFNKNFPKDEIIGINDLYVDLYPAIQKNHYAKIIPEGIRNLTVSQVKNDSNCEKIYLPSSMEIFDFRITRWQKEPKTKTGKNVYVEIDKRNPNFISLNGSVYTKDLSKLIYLYEAPDSQTEISDDCHVITAFSSVTVNTDFHFPKSLELIDKKALEAGNIGNIRIPSGVKILGNEFIVLKKDLTVEIPSSVEVIGKNKVRFEISEDNPYFTIIDNCIYSKNGKVFLQGHFDSDLKVKEGCIEIDLSKSDLTKLIVPESVEKIFGSHELNFKFEVAESNKYFSSYKDSLYSKDFSVLFDYSVPKTNDLIIHPDCRQIYSGALDIRHFKYSEKKNGIQVKKIDIPECLKNDVSFNKLKEKFI